MGNILSAYFVPDADVDENTIPDPLISPTLRLCAVLWLVRGLCQESQSVQFLFPLIPSIPTFHAVDEKQVDGDQARSPPGFKLIAALFNRKGWSSASCQPTKCL